MIEYNISRGLNRIYFLKYLIRDSKFKFNDIGGTERMQIIEINKTSSSAAGEFAINMRKVVSNG